MTEPNLNARFWRYWLAYTASSAGTAISSVALPLTAVLVLHATVLETGLLAASSYIAWLVVGLPAGVIVQRFSLRGTQVVMDVVRALAVISVPAAWGLGVLSLPQLVLVALVISFADVFFSLRVRRSFPRLCRKRVFNRRTVL